MFAAHNPAVERICAKRREGRSLPRYASEMNHAHGE